MSRKFKYKKNKNIKIAVIAILTLFIIFIIAKSFKNAIYSINQSQENATLPAQINYNASSYSSLEKLLESKNCKLIDQTSFGEKIIANVLFPVDLYSGTTSNENYFVNVSKLVAEFINYKNFELKDSVKNIDIDVICEKPNIVEFKINDDINYYLNHNSEMFTKNRKNSTTNFTIQSPELQKAINSNWNESNVKWGTKESTCEGYQIYFDEGIKYKVVSQSIFNIVFTKKYTGQIAGGLNANSTSSQVKSALGMPTFANGESLYGYVGENNYLFFDFINEQVSIYPVVKVEKKDEEKLKNIVNEMNNTNDVKTFANSLTNLWIDYDVYNFDSNYVDLRYTLKGLKLDISTSSLKNGIFIYKNYSGNIDISNLKNVYLTNEDFVFETEKDRASKEYLNRNLEGAFLEEEIKDYGINFSVKFNSSNENTYLGLVFYSRTQEFADSELDKNVEISSIKWYDESKLIYSINDDGIYVYNCETRVNAKIADVEGKIEILSAGNGQIVYNDNKSLNVEIN